LSPPQQDTYFMAIQQQALNKPFGTAKLFIGQIPKTMTEAYLRPLFAPFGQLIEVAIIRNRQTGESRGCAFVTYDNADSAELAIETLHGKQTLPGMSSPIQVKYAQGQSERPMAPPPEGLGMAALEGMTEYKLFVGMLPRSATEEDLRMVFQPYGKLIEIVVLREPDGTSKGCAFVKYDRRDDALNAINSCNGQMYFPDQTNPLTVKFADSSKKQMGGGGAQDAALMAQLKAQQLQIQMLMAQQYGQYGAAVDPYAAAKQMTMLTSMGLGRPVSVNSQTQGPPGANLFIYHLPTHYTDADLLTLFSPFGQILSVKVFLDKLTMVSKGFGFVSYTSADSARLAIEHMDGLQVGEKRLKVQLKKPRGSPY